MTKKPATILLADDDASIVDSTSLVLEYYGYSVVSTLDGASVPSMLTSAPDLVILDVWMGGVDGRDICKQIKSDKHTGHIPILMVSAGNGIRDSVMASGADDFLEKPFEMEALNEKIRKLIK